MEIKKWVGIKNTASEERLKPGELAAATDVDIDNTGKIWSRLGFTEINDTNSHSLYSDKNRALLMQGTSLKLIGSDLSLTTIDTLSNGNALSCDAYGDITYYSNGTDVGRIVGSTSLEWGVTPPIGQPAAAAIGGSLPPGRYMYALTFLRSDGHESGTGLAGLIDLTSGGGITFSGIEVSTNPEVSGKILYISSPNGEVMYRAMTLANTVVNAQYTNDTLDMTVPLTTQFAGPPPAGTLVRVYNGCAYVVVDDVIYYSDPYELELFRLDKNFLRMPSEVVMFECVNGGVYIGTRDLLEQETGGCWYLSGPRPDVMNHLKLYNYGVIPGTAVKTEAAYFQPPDPDAPEWSRPAVVWATRHGVCIGFDGGLTQNLTETRYSFPVAQRGAGLVRQTRGYAQYLVVLQGAGAANNIAP